MHMLRANMLYINAISDELLLNAIGRIYNQCLIQHGNVMYIIIILVHT